MNNSFYIPIHSMNLAHYLGSGIIAPSVYIENKNVDIQDGFKNFLLLSSSKFTRDTNCAIEIVLNSEEEVPKKISENFYLFDMPLPISRIKGIYFTNEEKKISSNFDITSGTAFIPEGLLKVSKEESIDTKELENIEYKPSEKNWADFLKRYDQILGGFSTMKISKENFQNYPTHYFSTLGNINNLFSNILEKQNISIENSFQFAFANDGKFMDFHNTIYSDIDYSEVQRYAEKDNVKLEVKNGIVQIDRIPENKRTYLVAILDSYGKGKRKQVDSFISDLISGKFSESKKEGLSLIFGLNKGYKSFRNKYKTQNFEVDIKFHLDSKLDYYVIESIYQRVFNSLNNILSFKYIDDLLAGNKQEEIKSSNYVTYQMIDKTIIWKQKVLSPLEKLLAKIAQKVHSWFPSFVEVKKNEIESIFKEEIEFFKNQIETDLENKFKVELEQNTNKIEDLNKTILEKDKIIIQLENQIKENTQTLIKSESKNKKEEVSEKDNRVKKNEEIIERTDFKTEKSETINTYEFQDEDIPNTVVQESVRPLFSDDSLSLRESELRYMEEDELKSIAKKYKISKRRTDLIIAEIIKHEFKQ